jgi:hypothetical protein
VNRQSKSHGNQTGQWSHHTSGEGLGERSLKLGRFSSRKLFELFPKFKLLGLGVRHFPRLNAGSHTALPLIRTAYHREFGRRVRVRQSAKVRWSRGKKLVSSSVCSLSQSISLTVLLPDIFDNPDDIRRFVSGGVGNQLA